MSNLTIFNFENQKIRINIDNEKQPWFCLKDICDTLKIGNTGDVRSRMESGGIDKIDVSINNHIYKMIFVNEPNLYRAIFQSVKAEAKRFQKWVFEEVLPQIRKTGSYGQQQLPLDKPKPSRRITLWESEGLTDTAQGMALKYFGHTSEKAHDAILMRLKYEADANDLKDMNQEQFDKAFRFLLKLDPEAKKLGDYCKMQEEDFIKQNVKGLALA